MLIVIFKVLLINIINYFTLGIIILIDTIMPCVIILMGITLICGMFGISIAKKLVSVISKILYKIGNIMLKKACKVTRKIVKKALGLITKFRNMLRRKFNSMGMKKWQSEVLATIITIITVIIII